MKKPPNKFDDMIAALLLNAPYGTKTETQTPPILLPFNYMLHLLFNPPIERIDIVWSVPRDALTFGSL